MSANIIRLENAAERRRELGGAEAGTGHWLGVEIGGTKLQLVVADAALNPVMARRYQVPAGQGAAWIRKELGDGIREVAEQFRLLAAGVGFGGPLDRKSGLISRSHQIEGWSGFNLKGWMEETSGVTVVVDNDANLGALAEARQGAGRDRDPVFYVTLGSGVGGGLVVGGEIYHGAAPGESEVGHLWLDNRGTTLESVCSGWAVDRKIRLEQAQRPESLLAQLARSGPGGEARHLRAALDAGDGWAWEILGQVTEGLAMGLSHVTHLVHPEVIILGGGLSLVGEPLRQSVAEALPTRIMEIMRPGPAIRLASLGEQVVPVGALLAARRLVGRESA